jgi:hypothetical protein
LKFEGKNKKIMEIIFVHGWNLFHPELIEKVEEFITFWRSSDENATYSNATFYGVTTKDSDKFIEIDEGGENQIKDLCCLIHCRLVKGGKEVYTTLLRY